MRLSFCHRQQRHIASALLFVWLFAVAASWANACLLRPAAAAEGRHGQHADHDLMAARGGNHGPAGDAGHSHEPDPAQQTCASFCDIEQSIVAKAQPAPGDGAVHQADLAAQPAVCWPALPLPPAEACWRPLAAPPPPGPPVAIAFLRLTI
jgi:hypothetical protein